MLNTSESPSAAAASSLSDILEETADVPDRYYLSTLARKGILTRCERRRRVLPAAVVKLLKKG
tara:strand:- start:388 stop:576 length:189 start_codon:yes stop_codon:yes gene_type:complete